MRIFFQNRPPCSHLPIQFRVADLTHPKTKTFFLVLIGIFSEPVGVRKLFVWDPAIRTGSILVRTVSIKSGDFQMPITLSKI